jgi:hypothetical protein
MTHGNDMPKLSAISARRGDGGHRGACATLSESFAMAPFLV